MTPQLCLCLDSLVLLGSELLRAVVKQLLVHLHEELQCVIDQTVNGPTVMSTQKRDKHIHVKTEPRPSQKRLCIFTFQ